MDPHWLSLHQLVLNDNNCKVYKWVFIDNNHRYTKGSIVIIVTWYTYMVFQTIIIVVSKSQFLLKILLKMNAMYQHRLS